MADGLCSMIVIMSILHNDCLGSSVRTRLPAENIPVKKAWETAG